MLAPPSSTIVPVLTRSRNAVVGGGAAVVDATAVDDVVAAVDAAIVAPSAVVAAAAAAVRCCASLLYSFLRALSPSPSNVLLAKVWLGLCLPLLLSMSAVPADMPIPIPPEIFGTPAAKLLFDRLLRCDWTIAPTVAFPEDWQTAMEQPPSDARTLQQVHKMLKIPRAGPHPQRRICDHCQAHIPDDQAAKCSICFNARYCSEACQKEHWRPHHKKTCTPPEPKVEQHVALVVPDYHCMWKYHHWFIHHPGSDTLGYTVMINNKQDFEKEYGHDAIERTVLKLALMGRPHPYAAMVYCPKSTDPSGSAGSGHAASPPGST